MITEIIHYSSFHVREQTNEKHPIILLKLKKEKKLINEFLHFYLILGKKNQPINHTDLLDPLIFLANHFISYQCGIHTFTQIYIYMYGYYVVIYGNGKETKIKIELN